MKERMLTTVVSCLAYCVDKELYRAIDYLQEQVKVLLEQQTNDKRLLLDDNQRRRLARKAKLLSSEMLKEMALIFTPATVLGWYNKLIAQKYR